MDSDAIRATARALGLTENRVIEILNCYANEVVKLGRQQRQPAPKPRAPRKSTARGRDKAPADLGAQKGSQGAGEASKELVASPS